MPRPRPSSHVAATVAALLLGTAVVGVTSGLVPRDRDDCPRHVGASGAGSRLDVLANDGVTFQRREGDVDPTRVGPPIGVVGCRVGTEVQRPGTALRDGEATFLSPGTPLHALEGVDPDWRLVMVDAGVPVVYERLAAVGASADALVPVAPGAVTAVAFVSAADGRTERDRLDEPDQVLALVEALRGAEVDPSAVARLPEGPRVLVRLELAGQPPLDLVVWPGEGLTSDGLVVPPSLLALLPPGE